MIERDRTVGIQESVVTDFHKPGGHHVLQEAADELHDLKGEDSWAITVGFAVANEDGAVLDFQDARVGDGDFEDVGGEVFEACFRGRDGLGVDVPIDLPDLSGDLIEEAGFYHFIAELGLEDFGERFDGEIEIGSGGMPAAIG